MQSRTEVGLTELEDSGSAKDLGVINLLRQFEQHLDVNRISWSTSLQLCESIGSGSQGRVFRGRRIGADGFQLPVAVKYFSPEIFCSVQSYEQAMFTVGKVSAIVAMIQHENLLSVSHFLNHDQIRVMVMEWIDGFDLRKLLTARQCGCVQDRCSQRRWAMLNELLFCPGPVQPRLRIGAVMCILRDCLSALSAMHEQGIIHNDLKPSNIMLNRAGRAKVIDLGSASVENDPTSVRTFTPAYSAPEVLTGDLTSSAASDLASLGYMGVEMLTGRPLTENQQDLASLLKRKLELPHQIPSLLEQEVDAEDALVHFFQKMTNPTRADRYQTAEQALLDCLEITRDRQFDTVARDCIAFWISELLERAEVI